MLLVFSRTMQGLMLAMGCMALLSCSGGMSQLKSDVSQLKRELKDLRSFQADQTTQLSNTQSQLRLLSGRIEELEFAQVKQLGGDLALLKKDLSNLRRRVPPPENVPAAALDADEQLAATQLPPEASRIFNNALMRVREGSFAEAVPLLRQAHDMSYGENWEANVEFWIALALDESGDFKNALAAYHHLNVGHPKHARVPLSLLKQAAVFVKLKDKKTAKLTYKKIVSMYPKSPEADQAKEKLKAL